MQAHRQDWDKIGDELLQLMSPWKDVNTSPAPDDAVEKHTKATAAAIDR